MKQLIMHKKLRLNKHKLQCQRDNRAIHRQMQFMVCQVLEWSTRGLVNAPNLDLKFE